MEWFVSGSMARRGNPAERNAQRTCTCQSTAPICPMVASPKRIPKHGEANCERERRRAELRDIASFCRACERPSCRRRTDHSRNKQHVQAVFQGRGTTHMVQQNRTSQDRPTPEPVHQKSHLLHPKITLMDPAAMRTPIHRRTQATTLSVENLGCSSI